MTEAVCLGFRVAYNIFYTSASGSSLSGSSCRAEYMLYLQHSGSFDSGPADSAICPSSTILYTILYTVYYIVLCHMSILSVDLWTLTTTTTNDDDNDDNSSRPPACGSILYLHMSISITVVGHQRAAPRNILYAL